MKKILALFVAMSVLIFSSLSHSSTKEHRQYDMDKAREIYSSGFNPEKTEIAVKMTMEIYDYLDKLPLNNFYNKKDFHSMLEDIFKIIDKYKDSIPLTDVYITSYIHNTTCEIKIDTLFVYSNFKVQIVYHIHKIKGIIPSCQKAKHGIQL